MSNPQIPLRPIPFNLIRTGIESMDIPLNELARRYSMEEDSSIPGEQFSVSTFRIYYLMLAVNRVYRGFYTDREGRLVNIDPTLSPVEVFKRIFNGMRPMVFHCRQEFERVAAETIEKLQLYEDYEEIKARLAMGRLQEEDEDDPDDAYEDAILEEERRQREERELEEARRELENIRRQRS